MPEHEGMTHGARRAVIVLFVITFAVGAANLLFTVAQVDKLGSQQRAACAFAADLGSAPLPDKPKPGKLGVSLVTDSRAQWRGLHCPGTLPVPPGLAKWAAYYHLPGN